MIIILNNTKNGETPLVLKPRYYNFLGEELPRPEVENNSHQDISGVTSVKMNVECGNDYSFTLMNSSDGGVIRASAKRYLADHSRLKHGITYHEFFVDDCMVMIDRPNKGAGMDPIREAGIPLGTVPYWNSSRTPTQKTMPIHAIVVISDINTTTCVRMNNQTNYSEKTTFVDGPYQYDIFLIRWSGWKKLKYRAAVILNVDNENFVYELGYTVNEKTGYCKDCLVELNSEGIADFLKYEKELEEAKANKAAIADKEKNVRRYPKPDGSSLNAKKRQRPPYNNQKQRQESSSQRARTYNSDFSRRRSGNPNSSNSYYKKNSNRSNSFTRKEY